MKIAVTGGIGSVGKAVVDMALAQGHSVVCIDRVAPGGVTSRKPALRNVDGHFVRCHRAEELSLAGA